MENKIKNHKWEVNSAIKQLVVVTVDNHLTQEISGELYDVEHDLYIIIFKTDSKKFITIPFREIKKIALYSGRILFEKSL